MSSFFPKRENCAFFSYFSRAYISKLNNFKEVTNIAYQLSFSKFNSLKNLEQSVCFLSRRTSYIVCPSSDEDKILFRAQERERFENPHKAFTYKLHGYESVVGPVKGVYTKESAVNKARDHALLIKERPAYVTILTLGKYICQSNPVRTRLFVVYVIHQ